MSQCRSFNFHRLVLGTAFKPSAAASSSCHHRSPSFSLLWITRTTKGCLTEGMRPIHTGTSHENSASDETITVRESSTSHLTMVSHHQHHPSRMKDLSWITSVDGSTTARTCSLVDTEKDHATQLVDSLLERTYQLMMHGAMQQQSSCSQDEYDQPVRTLPATGIMARRVGAATTPTTTTVATTSIIQHVIAFSGGIDSSLVAALVHHVHRHLPQHQESTQGGSVPQHVIRAVMGISPAVPSEQIDLAVRVADHIGIPFEMVQTYEGDDERYIANTGQACLACKTHLYSTLQAIVKHEEEREQHERTHQLAVTTAVSDDVHHHHHHSHGNIRYQLYNGTNADDRTDPTRLGLLAAEQFQVLSPLDEITKSNVRLAARHLGLFHWNYAASPCLRSRIALGVPATMQHLERIAQAERFVRSAWKENGTTGMAHNGASDGVRITPTNPVIVSYDESTNLRVRLLAGNRACIEVDAGLLEAMRYFISTPSWQQFFQSVLRFESVETRPFRSGSVARSS